jgi:lysyl-tRNA synthetase class 2
MTPETIRARGVLTAAVRSFFADKNYLEVETPLLAPALIPESAIEVFKTRFEHPCRPGRELYLVPSPELWMKRLLAAGFGNIFQICKAFRNAESIGSVHNPEFTILEYYTTGADYLDSLALTEELFTCLVQTRREKLAAPPQTGGPQTENLLAPPFRRMTVAQAFREYAGLDLEALAPRDEAESLPAARELTVRARALGLPAREGDAWEEAFNRIFVGRVETALPRDKPLALLDYPRGVRCLARDIPGAPWKERWELYVNGLETANCFTEETSPDKVAAYFREEAALKEKALVPHAIDQGFLGLYANPREAPEFSGREAGRTRRLSAPGSSAQGIEAEIPQAGISRKSPAEELQRIARSAPGTGGDAPQPSGQSSGVALGLDRLLMAFCGETSIGGVIFFPFSDILVP